MIFYFTGTGNSLAAAKKLIKDGEALVNMAEAINKNEYEYKVANGESVGFVFPVYFYSLPKIVINFINELKLENADYIYSVITCGGGISQAGSVLKKALAKKNLKLSYVTELLMPDNYILLYKNEVTGVDERLAEADKRLASIAKDIIDKKTNKIGNVTIMSDITAIMYEKARTTSKFYAEDSCTGCGLCARNCPEKAIVIENGKPVWKKDKCSQCLACINRCPVKAIQYGSRTKTQGRYVHPQY